jgi:hypothetical protein
MRLGAKFLLLGGGLDADALSLILPAEYRGGEGFDTFSAPCYTRGLLD